MKTLRVATCNPGKLREIRQLLTPLGYTITDVSDLEGFAVEEDGETFVENAIKKAEAVVALTGCPALADDSGLMVDALGGAPGVHSSRYAGVDPPAHDAANRDKLLAELAGIPASRRTARFVCALVYCRPGAAPLICEGVLEGRIGTEERGSGGFGYDSLFVLPARGLTTAEITAEEKNRMSHRGQALRRLAALLATQ